MDETKLKWAEFAAKYTVMLVVGIWTLSVGSEWLDKEQFELEYVKLSEKGFYPQAKPDFNIKRDNEPWVGNSKLCTVTGIYKVKNTGNYPISIDKVKFHVYENKPITEEDAVKNKVTSFSLSPTISKLKPIHKEEFKVNETIAPGMELNRGFGYVINTEKYALYTFMANAEGGLYGVTSLPKQQVRFGEDELKVVSGSNIICNVQP